MSHNNLFPCPMAFDMALQEVAFAMTSRGFRVDKKKRDELYQEYKDEVNKLHSNLSGVIGVEVKAKKNISDTKIKKWLYEQEKIKPRMKNRKITSDEDALRSIMAEMAAKIPTLKTQEARMKYTRIFLGIKMILRIKSKEKLLSTYLEAELDADDRIRCTINVGGAETARFSHSSTAWGTGANLATIPRDLRILFIADEGYELAEFDLNRGESWVYAHLSNDPELIRIHVEGHDFHSETASAISLAFGDKHYSVEDIIVLNDSGDKFGYKIRYLGKKNNHANAYVMGPFRAAEVVNAESDDTGITVTVGQMRKAQQLWKDKYIRMPLWWEEIKEEIKNNNRKLVTPYERERVFFGFYNDELWKEATAYKPQSTSVDYLNLGMLKVYNELDKTGKLKLLHQNHDSIVVMYKIKDRDEVIPEVIRRIENKEHSVRIKKYGYDFNIPVDAQFGQNWKKLEKYKIAT